MLDHQELMEIYQFPRPLFFFKMTASTLLFPHCFLSKTKCSGRVGDEPTRERRLGVRCRQFQARRSQRSLRRRRAGRRCGRTGRRAVGVPPAWLEGDGDSEDEVRSDCWSELRISYHVAGGRRGGRRRTDCF
uniref:Uncharacterized protein n=2 Tax=Aegilops tauschii subsp. strangulata TaxID=200361 RepID=A0A453QSI2_AEGTS